MAHQTREIQENLIAQDLNPIALDGNYGDVIFSLKAGAGTFLCFASTCECSASALLMLVNVLLVVVSDLLVRASACKVIQICRCDFQLTCSHLQEFQEH